MVNLISYLISMSKITSNIKIMIFHPISSTKPINKPNGNYLNLLNQFECFSSNYPNLKNKLHYLINLNKNSHYNHLNINNTITHLNKKLTSMKGEDCIWINYVTLSNHKFGITLY